MTRPPRNPNPSGRPTVLRLTDPASILTSVPYLVGFEPKDSLVLLALHGPRKRVGLTLRVDLGDGTPAAGRAVAAEAAGHVMRELSGSHPAAAIAVVYADEPPAGGDGTRVGSAARDALVDELTTRLGAAGVELLSVLRVAGGRWWADAPCADVSCCPPAGREVPQPRTGVAPSSATLAAATFVAEGRAVLPDRAALEHLLDPDPKADHDAIRVAMGEAGADRGTSAATGGVATGVGGARANAGGAPAGAGAPDGAAAPDRAVAPDGALVLRRLRRAARAAAAGRRLSDATVGRLAAGLRSVAVRDQVLSLVVDPDTAGLREVLIQLVRRLPPPDDAHVAAMLAWVAHAEGSGALANVAVQKALAGVPDHGLACLVDAALRGGLPPERLHAVARLLRSGRGATPSQRPAAAS